MLAVVPAGVGASYLDAGLASGWVGYAVGVLMAFLGARGREAWGALPHPGSDPRLWRARWWLPAAVGASVVTFAAARAHWSDSITLAFWLGSLGLLLIPLWWLPRRDEPAIGTFVAGQPRWARLRSFVRTRPPMWWGEVVACALVAVLAAAFRLPYLERFPVMVHNDEANCGISAQQVIEAWRQGRPFLFGTAGGFYDFPYLGFVPSALFQLAFPPNLYGHRLANVALSLLALLCLYLLVRDLWGRTAALLAVGLGGTAHFVVHWSRSGLHSGHATFLAVVAPFLAWQAVRSGRALWFAMLGCCLGACLMTYNAAFVVPLWLGTVFAVAWLGSAAFRRRHTASLALTGLGALIFFAPLLAHYVQAPETFMVRRSSLVFTTDPDMVRHLSAGFGEHYLIPLMRNNLERATLLLNRTGDSNLQYGWVGGGMVDSWTAVAFVLGLGVLAARLRHFASWTLLLGLLLPWLIGAVLSTDAVQYSRIAGLGLLMMVPPALWGRELYQAGRAAAGTWGCTATAALLAVGLAITGTQNFRLYFHDHDRRLLQRLPDMILAQVAMEARDAGADNVTFVFSQDMPVDFFHRSYLFLARNREVRRFDDVDKVAVPPDRRATFLIPTEHAEIIDRLQDRFPGGRAERRNLLWGEPPTAYLRYVVSPG